MTRLTPRKPYDRPDLDRPPAPNEWVIETVDFENSNSLAKGHTQPCQNCRDEIPVEEAHIMAMVRIFNGIGSGQYDRPRFCSRECWSEWAGGG